jgi:hypothetical protein
MEDGMGFGEESDGHI